MDDHRTRSDAMLGVLANARNRAILSALDELASPVAIDDLTAALVERDPDETSDERRLRLALHHVHLPRLEDAGLVTYDDERRVVTLDGWGSIDSGRSFLEGVETLADRFRGATTSTDDGVDVIGNRDDVIARGRELVRSASEELFLLAHEADTIVEACLDGLGEAIDRGVNVCIGTQDEEVRDQATGQLPGAIVWEPQFDWKRLPTRGPRIGQLVVADRRAVLLGLADDDAGGDENQMAMTGTGSTNPLVVLVRDLLGPRLDHLDYQSDEFRNQLPF